MAWYWRKRPNALHVDFRIFLTGESTGDETTGSMRGGCGDCGGVGNAGGESGNISRYRLGNWCSRRTLRSASGRSMSMGAELTVL